MALEPLNISEDKKDGMVLVYFDGRKFGPIPANTSIEDVRAALQKDFPEVSNAKITQDPETKDFTVTRSAGEKGL